jgi:hypothetical protein
MRRKRKQVKRSRPVRRDPLAAERAALRAAVLVLVAILRVTEAHRWPRPRPRTIVPSPKARLEAEMREAGERAFRQFLTGETS